MPLGVQCRPGEDAVSAPVLGQLRQPPQRHERLGAELCWGQPTSMDSSSVSRVAYRLAVVWRG